MSKKRITFLGIIMLIGLILTGCAGYNEGGYGTHDYPYYDNYGNYGDPFGIHEWGQTPLGWP